MEQEIFRLRQETARDHGVGSVLCFFFFFFLTVSVAFDAGAAFSAFFTTAADGGDTGRCTVLLGDVAEA